jgi:hypothetical protein
MKRIYEYVWTILIWMIPVGLFAQGDKVFTLGQAPRLTTQYDDGGGFDSKNLFFQSYKTSITYARWEYGVSKRNKIGIDASFFQHTVNGGVDTPNTTTENVYGNRYRLAFRYDYFWINRPKFDASIGFSAGIAHTTYHGSITHKGFYFPDFYMPFEAKSKRNIVGQVSLGFRYWATPKWGLMLETGVMRGYVKVGVSYRIRQARVIMTEPKP